LRNVADYRPTNLNLDGSELKGYQIADVLPYPENKEVGETGADRATVA
jgi:hypothetical protein